MLKAIDILIRCVEISQSRCCLLLIINLTSPSCLTHPYESLEIDIYIYLSLYQNSVNNDDLGNGYGKPKVVLQWLVTLTLAHIWAFACMGWG